MPEIFWQLAPVISQEETEAFPEVHPVILQLLANRGVKTQEAIDIFLGPDWGRDTHDPHLFLRMKEAVDRVFLAMERREMISVHGDYDADGVCGTAVLITVLRDICRQLKYDHARFSTYIPHREKEGYGLHEHTVRYLQQDVGTTLIITVDCGISNHQAIALAHELGMDTIVCDHHDVPEKIPEQAILIHPQAPGETYPFKHLSGTGVAFKFAHALLEEANRRGAGFHKGYEKWLLDLVAIATVTDIMPLLGENRVLEHYGLLVLNKTRRVGLKKLVEVSGGEFGKLDTTSIGYQIGPRLNAAGRMHHADVALQLLIEEDEDRALAFAKELQQLNVERQKQSEAIFQEAKRQVEAGEDLPLIVVVGEGWPAGLVGLVAGKLVAAYHRPVFVIGQEGEEYVGSGRSLGGFHMTEALQGIAEHLDAFGGHPQACGFSTRGKERLARVVSGLLSYARQTIPDPKTVATIAIDAEIPLALVNWDFYQDLEKFAPFGEKNPRPVFCSRQLMVMGMDTVGTQGKHLRLFLQSPQGSTVKCIGFKFGDWMERLHLGAQVDVVYEMGVNEWNGSRELQCSIRDLRLSSV
jgi:single-stranded-DNA-specific exonuclease